MNARELRRLEVEAELSKLHAAQCDARAKAAALEVERAQLQTQSLVVSTARTGISFVGVLALVLAAAIAGAVLTAPTMRAPAAAMGAHP
jgi:hypothetical protein